MKLAINTLVNLFFPVYCLACGKTGEWFCQSCVSKLHFSTESLAVKNNRHATDGIWVVMAPGQTSVEKLIKYFKYSGVKDIGEILGSQAGDFLKAKFKELPQLRFDAVTSVPTSKRRFKWRGYNQSEILGQVVATKIGLEYIDGLQRVKYIRPQVGLNSKNRVNNVKNNFAVALEFEPINKNILIIDDVVTTGSTINECAAVLKKRGANLVWGVAIIKG